MGRTSPTSGFETTALLTEISTGWRDAVSMLSKVHESAALMGQKNKEVQGIDKLSSIAIPSSDIAGEIL